MWSNITRQNVVESNYKLVLNEYSTEVSQACIWLEVLSLSETGLRWIEIHSFGPVMRASWQFQIQNMNIGINNTKVKCLIYKKKHQEEKC